MKSRCNEGSPTRKEAIRSAPCKRRHGKHHEYRRRFTPEFFGSTRSAFTGWKADLWQRRRRRFPIWELLLGSNRPGHPGLFMELQDVQVGAPDRPASVQY